MENINYIDKDVPGDFFVNPDGIKLYRIIYPSSIPKTKAIVFVCHGLFGHCRSGFYDPIIRPLNDIGCMIITHDHKGHGRSDGPRGIIDNFDSLVRDVLLDIDDVLQLQIHKDVLPIFIYGHSMGGLIAVYCVLRRSNFFSGICLEAPLLMYDRKHTGTALSCGRWISHICPKLPTSKITAEEVCRNKDYLESIKHDNLRIQFKIPLQTGFQVLEAVELVKVCFKDIKTPFIIGHGDDDRLSLIDGSKSLFEICPVGDKKLIVYSKAKHTIRFEIENIGIEFRNEIVNWINDRS